PEDSTMPDNRFNAFTNLGVGIGLRIPHYKHILDKKPACDWFEIISENYMCDGGRPLHVLAQLPQFADKDIFRGCGIGDSARSAGLCDAKTNVVKTKPCLHLW
ncbi:MAG TPA: DUF692 family protein, partial [Terracidiphilus sp.]|nr:DUF692 family protein [Terracidiphilus sp.]